MQQRIYLITVETADHDADLLAMVPAIIRGRLAGTALTVTDIQSQP
jgi:hypothetical protein